MCCFYLLEKQTKNIIQVYLCPVTLSTMKKAMITSMVLICKHSKYRKQFAYYADFYDNSRELPGKLT